MSTSSQRVGALVALGLGGFAVLLGHLYLTRFEKEHSGGVKVQVLAMMREVPAGTTLSSGMLAVRSVPMAYVDDRQVLAKDRDKVIGIDTVLRLRGQSTLLWSDIAVRTDIRNLSELVSPGKRAVQIKVSGASTANSLMRPGDYIDIIATLPGLKSGKNAVLLLQRILVVAVGLRTEPHTDGQTTKGRDGSALTVSLDVEEAQLIKLATAKGKLSVLVRNPDDERIYKDLPDIESSALLQVRDTLQARKRTRRAPDRGPVPITN